jgi:hypothetical protein
MLAIMLSQHPPFEDPTQFRLANGAINCSENITNTAFATASLVVYLQVIITPERLMGLRDG